jgi:alpha-beta hydrolase superfamily lysophospholipase
MDRLSERRVAVFTPDLRGHGRSARLLGYVDSLEALLEDIRRLHTSVREALPGLPVFLLGQSLGGTLALLYASRHQEQLRGLVLSGGMVKLPAYASPFLVAVSGIVARLLPRLPVQPFDYTRLCTDPAVTRALVEDELYYKKKMRARTGFVILESLRQVQKVLPGIRLPILILHGGEDVTVEPESAKVIEAGVSSPDRTKRIYPGALHRIFDEPSCKEEALRTAVDWVEAHLA